MQRHGNESDETMTINPNDFHFLLLSDIDMSRLLGCNPLLQSVPVCGSLWNRMYYAAANARRSYYRLFLNKMEYIAYFLNYYFSYNNTIQDKRMRPFLLEYSGMPICELLNFRRLAKVRTSPWEIDKAVKKRLPHLKVVGRRSGGIFVCRKDEYYAIDATIEDLMARMK
nr:hypothetical protein HmN_000700900 [Hymenolepis microstoma]